jgi:hypothetical protein
MFPFFQREPGKPKPKPAAPPWSAEWPSDTMQVAYAEAQEAVGQSAAWADALDTKVTGVFAVAAIIVTVVPTFQQVHSAGVGFFWLVAFACFLGAAWNARLAYQPRPFRFGPNPSLLRDKEWLALPADRYRYRMLRWLGDTFEYNNETINSKADALSRAIAWTAIEVVALGLALVLPALT